MSQELRKTLATNVNNLREKAHLKREQLSLLLDFDNSYISKLEKGKINITLDKLGQLAVFFNVSIMDLFKQP